MAQITLKGNPIHTVGDLPGVGSTAPDFVLTARDLTDRTLADLGNKKKVLNITPSLETSVCAASAKRFDTEAAKLPDTVVLHVTCDLPFAQARFCDNEHIETVITLSQLRNREFGKQYGVEITDGPMAGLLARAVVVLDRDNRVVYTELVPEIGQEPAYDAALEAIGNA